MPPKHKLETKNNKTQSTPRTKSHQSSTSDNHIVNSTNPESIDVQGKSSLDLPSLTSTPDAFTIVANDRQYVQISKRILQYELQRKRISVTEMFEQTHLEDGETSLSASITSDWRLVLQDSISIDDLRQGCLSLFDQVNSELQLTPNEVLHAVRFLEYTGIFIKHCTKPQNELLETVFPEETQSQTKLTVSLLKLVFYPSDRLQTGALSFFDVIFSSSTKELKTAMVVTGLFPQLFEKLTPHEIPLNRTTHKFHCHLTSIVDTLLSICKSDYDSFYLGGQSIQSSNPQLPSEVIEPIVQSGCRYLRYLLAAPACPTDFHSGISLLSKMGIFKEHIMHATEHFGHLNVAQFFHELRTNMTRDLVSSLDLTTTGEALKTLLFNPMIRNTESFWVKTLEGLIARMNEGKQCSDLGFQGFMSFMDCQPKYLRMGYCTGETFVMAVHGTIISSLDIPTKSLIALFIPTKLHHTTAILSRLHEFISHLSHVPTLQHIWSGWFTKFFEIVAPLELPFTAEFNELHTRLIDVIFSRVIRIRFYTKSMKDDQCRGELDEFYLSFHEQTKDYLIYLSLHPFALERCNQNVILDFFTDFFGSDLENRLMIPYQVELRQAMNASDLSLSCSPFILTSDLVCHLPDEEIMNVVDRIVALLQSDAPIDDDTILRIHAFHKYQLKSVYLPQLFRNAGRTTEQFFHAFETLLSLPIDNFQLCPINNLLTPKPPTIQPTFDEWNDVDLETVGVVMRTINDAPPQLNRELFLFLAKTLHQIHSSATRLNESQLERLITPSINIIGKSIFGQEQLEYYERDEQENVFIEISQLCDRRVIAQCLGKIGVFSHIVSGLLEDRTYSTYRRFLHALIYHIQSSGNERAEMKKLRRAIHLFMEEGWQDALDAVIILTKACGGRRHRITLNDEIMQFFGVNFRGGTQ